MSENNQEEHDFFRDEKEERSIRIPDRLFFIPENVNLWAVSYPILDQKIEGWLNSYDIIPEQKYDQLLRTSGWWQLAFPSTENSISSLSRILNVSLLDTGLRKNENVHIKYKTEKKANVNTACSICQEDFDPTQDTAVLTCGHMFHPKCVEEWGKYKPECPVCRKKIPVV